MNDFEQDWIEKRAYAIWEEEGYTAGRDGEHWDRAKQEFDALVAAKAIDPNGETAALDTAKTETSTSPEPVKSPAPAKRRSKKATTV